MITLEQIQKREPLTGAATFMDRIIYAPRTSKDVGVLYFASTHALGGLNSMGRLLITSEQNGAGKTTYLDAASMMCQNFWMADPTRYALQAKFLEPDKPTLGMDEVGVVFGPNGTRGLGNPLYKPLVEGYRRTATFSISIDRTATDVSSYSAAVLAGKGPAAVPPDLYARSIHIRMQRCPASVELEDSLDEGVMADGQRIGDQMHAWARLFIEEIGTVARDARKLHPKLKGRRLQVWGPLFAMAQMAGGDWPRRCMDAFLALALDESEKPVLSAEQQLLHDTGAYLAERELAPDTRYLYSAELLRFLRTLDEKLYTSKTDRQMAQLMKAGLGSSHVITLPDRKKVRGWPTAGILAAYRALLDELQPEEPEEEEDEYDTFFDTEGDEDEDEGQAVA